MKPPPPSGDLAALEDRYHRIATALTSIMLNATLVERSIAAADGAVSRDTRDAAAAVVAGLQRFSEMIEQSRTILRAQIEGANRSERP